MEEQKERRRYRKRQQHKQILSDLSSPTQFSSEPNATRRTVNPYENLHHTTDSKSETINTSYL